MAPKYQRPVPQPNVLPAVPDDADLGPAMRALNERQKKFVLALNTLAPETNHIKNYTAAYHAAGYTSTGENAQQIAWRMAHDDKIQAALVEEGRRRFGGLIPIAQTVVTQILLDPTATRRDRMTAASMIWNRAGLSEITEHHVQVERKLSTTEKVERAVALAKELGLDPRETLAKIGIDLPTDTFDKSNAIDAEFEVVEDWSALPDE